MLKKSTFIVMLIYFIIIFFLFQLLMLGFGWSDSLSTNPANITNDPKATAEMLNPSTDEANEVATVKRETEFLVVTGGEESNVTETVTEWLKLHKHAFAVADGLEEANIPNSLKEIYITTADIAKLGGVEAIRAVLKDGVKLVFCQLPSLAATSEEVMELISVRSVGKEYIHKGLDVFEGMLLGGMFRSEDMEVKTQEVKLGEGVKVYSCAYDEDVDNEDNTPLIWRTYYKSSPVFVINADFLERKAGIGILSGLMAQSTETYVYPVINSKSMLLLNFPMISNESEDDFVSIYSRNVLTFTRDIMWSDLLASMNSLDSAYTCYMAPCFEAASLESFNANQDILSFFSKEFFRAGCEIGIGNPFEGTGAEIKALTETAKALKEQSENYIVHSVFADHVEEIDLENVQASNLPGYYDEGEKSVGFTFVNENVVNLPITIKGGGDEDIGDKGYFENICFATALGYINYSVDFEPIFTNKTSAEMYMKFNKVWGDEMFALFSPFRKLEAKTATEAATRVKSFVTAEIDINISDDQKEILITTNTEENTYVMLKSEHEIDTLENASNTWLEKGTHMIEIEGREASITLK